MLGGAVEEVAVISFQEAQAELLWGPLFDLKLSLKTFQVDDQAIRAATPDIGVARQASKCFIFCAQSFVTVYCTKGFARMAWHTFSCLS